MRDLILLMSLIIKGGSFTFIQTTCCKVGSQEETKDDLDNLLLVIAFVIPMDMWNAIVRKVNL